MSVFRHGLTFVPLRLSAQVGRADQSCGAVRRYTVAYAMGR